MDFLEDFTFYAIKISKFFNGCSTSEVNETYFKNLTMH